MGIAFRKLIGNSGILAVWEVTESTAQLELSLIPEELEEFITKPHLSDKRKREWLATRCLLKTLIAHPEKICYHENGAPYLASSSNTISISHSEGFVAVYLHPKDKIGVDIQKARPIVIKGADFFLNDFEKGWISSKNVSQHNLIWSAKESIYKYLRESDLDFKNDLQICPVSMEQFGNIEAYIHNKSDIKSICLQFEWIGDYVLTWTV